MFAPSQRHRSLAALSHLSALLGFWQPVLSVIGPLVAWLSLRDESSFVEDQAREALNFQLSILLWTLLGVVLTLLTFGLALIVVVPIALVGAVLNVCLTIVAALNANEGKRYRYPFTIRIVQ